jgi:hypothetical protein
MVGTGTKFNPSMFISVHQVFEAAVPLGVHLLNGCGFVSLLWDVVMR